MKYQICPDDVEDILALDRKMNKLVSVLVEKMGIEQVTVLFLLKAIRLVALHNPEDDGLIDILNDRVRESLIIHFESLM